MRTEERAAKILDSEDPQRIKPKIAHRIAQIEEGKKDVEKELMETHKGGLDENLDARLVENAKLKRNLKYFEDELEVKKGTENIFIKPL